MEYAMQDQVNATNSELYLPGSLQCRQLYYVSRKGYSMESSAWHDHT